jgi:xanthosine utilization system XapX-like protein
MKSFWDSVDFLDVGLFGMGFIVLLFMLLMWYQGRTPDPYVIAIFGTVFLILFGKQIPTAASNSLLKVAIGKPISVLQPQNQPQFGAPFPASEHVLPKSTKTCDASPATGNQ